MFRFFHNFKMLLITLIIVQIASTVVAVFTGEAIVNGSVPKEWPEHGVDISLHKF